MLSETEQTRPLSVIEDPSKGVIIQGLKEADVGAPKRVNDSTDGKGRIRPQHAHERFPALVGNGKRRPSKAKRGHALAKIGDGPVEP